jgi:hypothetical protein
MLLNQGRRLTEQTLRQRSIRLLLCSFAGTLRKIGLIFVFLIHSMEKSYFGSYHLQIVPTTSHIDCRFRALYSTIDRLFYLVGKLWLMTLYICLYLNLEYAGQPWSIHLLSQAPATLMPRPLFSVPSFSQLTFSYFSASSLRIYQHYRTSTVYQRWPAFPVHIRALRRAFGFGLPLTLETVC